MTADDETLLATARRDARDIDWRTLEAELLRKLAAARGIEYATALLYESIRRDPVQAAAMQAIEALARQPVPDLDPPHLLVVPGAFHKHHRHTGADGAKLIGVAREIGWSAEVLDVGSLSPVSVNARLLIERLRGCQASRVVLASLSKGSADVAEALADRNADGAFAKVWGWISFSGLTHGTPLVAWLRERPLRLIGVHLLLWMKRLRFSAVDELRRETNGPRDRDVVVPPHLRAIHVLGFPLRRHLAHPWAHRGYERLAPLGPNDGGGILLADATRLPGIVCAVWGADHYLQPTDGGFDRSLRGLLRHAAQSQTAASAIPTSKSTA